MLLLSRAERLLYEETSARAKQLQRAVDDGRGIDLRKQVVSRIPTPVFQAMRCTFFDPTASKTRSAPEGARPAKLHDNQLPQGENLPLQGGLLPQASRPPAGNPLRRKRERDERSWRSAEYSSVEPRVVGSTLVADDGDFAAPPQGAARAGAPAALCQVISILDSSSESDEDENLSLTGLRRSITPQSGAPGMSISHRQTDLGTDPYLPHRAPLYRRVQPPFQASIADPRCQDHLHPYGGEQCSGEPLHLSPPSRVSAQHELERWCPPADGAGIPCDVIHSEHLAIEVEEEWPHHTWHMVAPWDGSVRLGREEIDACVRGQAFPSQLTSR